MGSTSAVTATTTKGAARAESILEATLICLARDGYAATSMQRVAEQAGVSKRSVPYYFTSRDGLLEHAAERLIGHLVAQIRAAIGELDDAPSIINAGLQAMWDGLTHDRALLVAWYGLQSEAITNPALTATAARATGHLRALIDELIDDHLARGGTLARPAEAIQVSALAWVQGLALEWIERGTTPALQASLDALRAWLEHASGTPTA